MSKELSFCIAHKLYTKITDGTHDSPKRKRSGKPLITSKHIKGRNIDFETAYLISENDFNKINLRSKVEQWDVIVSMIGEYCGFCYIERNESIDYAVKNVGIYKTGSELEANWLYYYLSSSIGKSYLNSVKSGSSQPYLTLGGLRMLPVLQPRRIEEKRKIAKVLSDLDAKIELNNKINAELETMAKLIYDYWFVQFDFPDENGKPYKSSGDKMVYTEELKREIPEGWSSGIVSDIFEFNPTLSIKKGVVSSYIDMNALPESGFMTKKVKKKAFGGGMKFQNGDVAVARITPCLENGKTGLISLLEKDEVGFGSTEFIIIRGRELRLSGFACCLSRSEKFRKYAISKMTGTSGRKRVKADALERYKMPIPDSDILKSFEEKVAPFFSKMTMNVKENQKLAELRDWLLPMLMNGQVKVK